MASCGSSPKSACCGGKPSGTPSPPSCGGKPCGTPSPPSCAGASGCSKPSAPVELPPPASACCPGGGCCPEPQAYSRYPKPLAAAALDPSRWAVAPAPAAPQFQDAPAAAAPEKPWEYAGLQLAALDFPLGGLGAGNAYLMGDGALGGFTVVNQVRQESQPTHCMPGCFFGASAEVDGQQQAFCLISPQNYTPTNASLPVHCAAHVAESSIERLQALPGIRGLRVSGTFPIADVEYDINGFPVTLSMEALTPMIPTESKDSSVPACIFRFTAKNEGKQPVTLRLLQAQQNFVGWDGQADCTKGGTSFWGGNVNTPATQGTFQGLSMTCQSVDAKAATFGSLAAGAVKGDGKVSVLPGAATEEELWSQFLQGASAALQACPRCCTVEPTKPSAAGTSWVGGVVQELVVPAGGSASASFVLAWHFPNRQLLGSVNGQHNWDKILPEVLGNFYSTFYKDASAAAQYVADNFQRLYSKTLLYRDVLFRSSIDPYVLDCAAGRIAVATGPTMWRCQDGTVLGSEGNGCCPLNCSHVYGYSTLLERLFPDWAKSMLSSNFGKNFDQAGGVTMRFGTNGFAIDGSLASVIKAYLTVQQSDSGLAWLKTVWPNIKVQMQLAMTKFDGGDGVIRVPQRNTYDTAMNGANTFIGSYYVTALRACSAMAELMGEADLAKTYQDRAELSIKAYEEICWKEDFGYYVADVTIKDCQSSYGPGCFVDQLCAIGLSSACGFGYCFEPKHEASARHQIASNNRVHSPPFHDLQKHFFPGDTGVTVCTYPNGKLGDGMTYDTLVSIGFTYPVVAGLLLDRNLEDAEVICQHIRQRHDGRNRSPWNEPECGLLYSRAMAAWNLLDQACGFRYDCTKGLLGFDPRYNEEDFRCFFVAEGAWGEFSQQGPKGLGSGKVTVSVLHGDLSLSSLQLASSATAVSGAAGASVAEGIVTFAKPVEIKEGSSLTLELSSPEEDAWEQVEAAELPSF